MIFTDYNDKLFFADIFLHLEFSFIVTAVIFHLAFRRNEKKRIDKAMQDVLESNILSGLSSKTSNDTDNLKVLKKIYNNEDFNDRSYYYLKKNSWTTIIIISIFVVLFSLELKSQPNFYFLLLDKILLFACIGIVLYLQESFISSNFNIVFEKEIYKTMRDRLKKLKSSTTY